MQRGAINGQLIVIICLLVIVVGLTGLSAWLFTQYNEKKTDVDGQINAAVTEAKKEQAELEEKKFAEREKEPNREFAAPEDFGGLTFMYPKTWSVYVDQDTTTNGNRYSAYLNPITVPPISSKSSRYALRITIETIDYGKRLDSYKSAITKGELRSSPFSVNGHDGTRLDGNISKDVRGSAVLFKIRDKTMTIFTEAETFKEDFDNILKTVDFNA
jgi:hypothetical protein